MPGQLGENAAIVTLWFVSASDPQSIIRSEPRADRGYGRKLLAQLNPAWPITPIGQFALNRSVPASENEFYIAGFPGITIIQTVLEDVTSLSKLSPRLLKSVPATDIYVFAVNEETTLGGFAHLVDGKVKRSFIAYEERVFEDDGIPSGFEAPYWAGKMGTRKTPLALPFNPIELVAEAQRAWLGFDLSTSPDINVVAYATDGRPEPKIAQPRLISSAEVTQAAVDKLRAREASDYDDYEQHEAPDRVVSQRMIGNAKKAAESAQRMGKSLWRAGREFGANMAEKLRHTDR
ncbi:hypothetical protein CDES_04160 [Corynebacterium deserti GIMN1.010]|uniref:Uncharacterized protein n=1 Tax=Corynebacterium deserti GIMN1.010 TaxID=931089 RepID=A0A0M4CD12_9CORY|nr:hypothetical protein [Corynebacterium deserti]ALC05278.1 hypothetical protein CDES_04160 [Corynebacterium deserti GIMN1.010]